MRLKTFTAETMAKAMDQVKRTLGDEAIIVSTLEIDEGVQLTAAIEEDHPIHKPKSYPLSSEMIHSLDLIKLINKACSYHGIPEHIEIDWINKLPLLSKGELFCPKTTLKNSLASLLNLNSSWLTHLVDDEHPQNPIVFVGPSGGGKSISLAKLMAYLISEDKQAKLLTTDTLKAGAIPQMHTYTQAMDQNLYVAENIETMLQQTDYFRNQGIVLIDTPGVNPYEPDEIEAISYLTSQLENVHVCLVLPAGMDVEETQEITEKFAPTHPHSLIFTRMDCTKRYGNAITMAHQAHLPLAAFGGSPNLGDGLHPWSPAMSVDLLFHFLKGSEHTS